MRGLPEIAALMVGFAAMPAQAQWTVAAQTAKSSFLVPVEPSWKHGPETLRTLTVLLVRKTNPKTEVVSDQTGWEFNCVTRTYRIVSSERRDWRGGLVGTAFTPTEWAAFNDGVAGYLSGFACGETKPIGPEYPNVKAAVAALWVEAAPTP